jgi:hypothetical protein
MNALTTITDGGDIICGVPMPITPEDRARENIDKLLGTAGWIVQHKKEANLSAGRGVAVREFPET